MRRAAVAVLVAACGGADVPAKRPEPPPEAPRATRVPIEDGDDDNDIEIASTRGRMDPAVIEAGLEPHKEELSACYLTRVGKRRWLGGRASLHWEIQRDGTVTAVKLAESDLGAWPIEKCLLEVARGATFGKPVGGDADFSLPLEFSAKGSVAVWDEDQSLKAIGGQVAAFDACARAKGVKGGLPEDVTVTLYVGALGKAESVGFSSPRSVLDDAWAECAEKAALAWRLPDPRGGVAKLAIRYRAPQ